jgi:outer membrane lipoprotein SlyB
MNRTHLPLVAAAVMALGLTACASTGSGYRDYDNRGRYSYDSRCQSCGTVERIDVARYGDGRTTGGGAIAGALIGAAVGNQVGSGSGRRAATVAGAVAGGIAGNNIERNRNDGDVFEVVVRMDDGRRVIVEQRSLNGLREGARVQVRDGRAQLI